MKILLSGMTILNGSDTGWSHIKAPTIPTVFHIIKWDEYTRQPDVATMNYLTQVTVANASSENCMLPPDDNTILSG